MKTTYKCSLYLTIAIMEKHEQGVYVKIVVSKERLILVIIRGIPDSNTDWSYWKLIKKRFTSHPICKLAV